MAANKRTRHQIANDRRLISKMLLEGRTQAEIAARLGVSQPQICYDARQIRKEWSEEVKTTLAEQLAKIDHIEHTAWEAWFESRGFQTRTQTVGKTGSEKIEPSRVTITSWRSPGNPQYLQKICWCVEQRSKLLGLYSPAPAAEIESQIGSDSINVVSSSPEELDRFLVSHFAEKYPDQRSLLECYLKNTYGK